MRFNVCCSGLARLLAVLAILTIIPNLSQAQEVGVAPPPQAKSPQPPIAAWNGSYADRIDIQVPGFRGLEPNISLTYDSSRGVRNIPSAGGILGVGWSMGGLSTIERVSGSFVPAVGVDIKTDCALRSYCLIGEIWSSHRPIFATAQILSLLRTST